MATSKNMYEKPGLPHVTDLGIMLDCLHEVYGSEEEVLKSGKDVRTTMAYPFIKMIELQCNGMPAQELHQLLWNIYLAGKEKSAFIGTAKKRLEA